MCATIRLPAADLCRHSGDCPVSLPPPSPTRPHRTHRYVDRTQGDPLQAGEWLDPRPNHFVTRCAGGHATCTGTGRVLCCPICHNAPMEGTPALADPRLSNVDHEVVEHGRVDSLEEAAELRGVDPSAAKTEGSGRPAKALDARRPGGPRGDRIRSNTFEAPSRHLVLSSRGPSSLTSDWSKEWSRSVEVPTECRSRSMAPRSSKYSVQPRPTSPNSGPDAPKLVFPCGQDPCVSWQRLPYESASPSTVSMSVGVWNVISLRTSSGTSSMSSALRSGRMISRSPAR